MATLGGACSRLLDGLAQHLSAPRPHAGASSPDALLAPRAIFALLQSPINADASGIGAFPAPNFDSQSVRKRTFVSMKPSKICTHSTEMVCFDTCALS